MKISYNFGKVHFIQEMNQKATFKRVCQLWNKIFPKVDPYIKWKVSLTSISRHSGTLDPKILQRVIRNFTFWYRHLGNHKTSDETQHWWRHCWLVMSEERKLPIKSSFQVKTKKSIYHMKDGLKTVVDSIGSHAYKQIWRNYGQKFVAICGYWWPRIYIVKASHP